MQTDLNTAKAWLSTFDSAPNPIKMPSGFKDWDAYMDARDTAPFDSRWSQAHEELTQQLQALSEEDRVALESLQEAARAQIFTKSLHLTGSYDVASYTSDDAELIFGSLALNLDSRFVHRLRSAYEKGTCPNPN